MTSSTKRAIVTGATGAIGKALARQMVERGYHVTIIARNENKAQQAVKDIQLSTEGAKIDYMIADLMRKAEIERIADAWDGVLNVLINNAAIAPRRREVTPEGIEMQFAANVLGYFWMINSFRPFLKQGAPSRIVNVASYWAGDLDINDLECKKRRYNNDTIYRQSKQADRMLSSVFAGKLKADRITVNAVHPGDVNSFLSNSLGYGGHETPDQGADTPVWAATAPELEGVTGKYFEHRRETPCRFSQDIEMAARLFNICESY
jgi:retinol dehydrogenase 12